MDLDLEGRRALVTGSSGGIGAEIARALASEGARVVVHGRSAEKAEGVVDEIRGEGGEAISVLGDLSSDPETETMVLAVEQELGGVDILVNHVGSFHAQPWETTDVDGWRATLEATLLSTVRMCRRFAPGMSEREWGRLIQVASVSATIAPPPLVSYAAAKAGVVNLTLALSQEYGLSIGDLADASGKSVDTLRYYEDEGLIPNVRRNEAGHRAELSRRPKRNLVVSVGDVPTFRAPSRPPSRSESTAPSLGRPPPQRANDDPSAGQEGADGESGRDGSRQGSPTEGPGAPARPDHRHDHGNGPAQPHLDAGDAIFPERKAARSHAGEPDGDQAAEHECRRRGVRPCFRDPEPRNDHARGHGAGERPTSPTVLPVGSRGRHPGKGTDRWRSMSALRRGRLAVENGGTGSDQSSSRPRIEKPSSSSATCSSKSTRASVGKPRSGW